MLVHIKEYNHKNGQDAEPPRANRSGRSSIPVLSSGTFDENVPQNHNRVAAAAGHDNGHQDAVKAQHDNFTGLPAGNNLLNLRDVASMPGSLLVAR